MEARPATWGEVEPSMVVRDNKLKHWLILAQKTNALGERWLRLRGEWKDERSIKRPADETPTVIMEASEVEAVMLASEGGLRGAVISHENTKTLPLRAMNLRMDPIDITGKGGKDRIHWHVDEYHTVYLEPGMTAKKAAEAHEEMHAAESLTMTTPHHHGGTT